MAHARLCAGSGSDRGRRRWYVGDDIYARTLALGGGAEAFVVVLPQASAVADAGDGSVERWMKMGAKVTTKVAFADALIVDARGARVSDAAPGAVHGGQACRSVLRAGMTFDLR